MIFDPGIFDGTIFDTGDETTTRPSFSGWNRVRVPTPAWATTPVGGTWTNRQTATAAWASAQSASGTWTITQPPGTDWAS